jgi:hypothetical protein
MLVEDTRRNKVSSILGNGPGFDWTGTRPRDENSEETGSRLELNIVDVFVRSNPPSPPPFFS